MSDEVVDIKIKLMDFVIKCDIINVFPYWNLLCSIILMINNILHFQYNTVVTAFAIMNIYRMPIKICYEKDKIQRSQMFL